MHKGEFLSPTNVAECGGNLGSGKGTFASPNYPEDYSSNMDCEWVIRFIPNYDTACLATML